MNDKIKNLLSKFESFAPAPELSSSFGYVHYSYAWSLEAAVVHIAQDELNIVHAINKRRYNSLAEPHELTFLSHHIGPELEPQFKATDLREIDRTNLCKRIENMLLLYGHENAAYGKNASGLASTCQELNQFIGLITSPTVKYYVNTGHYSIYNPDYVGSSLDIIIIDERIGTLVINGAIYD